jgi:hypothetical protein
MPGAIMTGGQSGDKERRSERGACSLRHLTAAADSWSAVSPGDFYAGRNWEEKRTPFLMNGSAGMPTSSTRSARARVVAAATGFRCLSSAEASATPPALGLGRLFPFAGSRTHRPVMDFHLHLAAEEHSDALLVEP